MGFGPNLFEKLLDIKTYHAGHCFEYPCDLGLWERDTSFDLAGKLRSFVDNLD